MSRAVSALRAGIQAGEVRPRDARCEGLLIISRWTDDIGLPLYLAVWVINCHFQIIPHTHTHIQSWKLEISSSGNSAF